MHSMIFEFQQGVISGRFAPPVNADMEALEAVFRRCAHVHIVVTGADRAPSTQMPWSAKVREEMIRAALGPLAGRAVFCHVRDHLYRPDLADTTACDAVMAQMPDDGGGLLGAETLSHPPAESPQAEALRAAFLRKGAEAVAGETADAVLDILRAYAATPDYARLHEEQLYIDNYKKSWAAAPWPPIFVTCDTLIQHGRHLLLIKRGGQPGKGLWALPGGFVEPDERLLSSAVREVAEETRLELSAAHIAEHLVSSQVFDYPKRSARGRTITHAFHFRFPEGPLPPVEAADDAEGAHWVAIDDLAAMRDRFFEDHADIIDFFRLA
jgi:bifunctional NMN adenylyltransferase/nudix hydrolase